MKFDEQKSGLIALLQGLTKTFYLVNDLQHLMISLAVLLNFTLWKKLSES